MATTERIALPAPVEPPSPRLQPFEPDRADARAHKRERAERQIILARSTLIGLCLTAFACGIVTTVALDRHHFRALEHELRGLDTEQAVQAPPPPSAPAPEVVAEAPVQAQAPAPAPAATPAPEPVVVQMAPPAPVTPGKAVDEPAKPAVDSNKAAEPATARVAVARTPRPAAAPRPAVHRKPAPTASADDFADPTPKPAAAPAAPGWKDPFAE